MGKSIVIIGSGIAGLAAGVYARMNGYETVVFESHDKPGGVCTAWQRNGYTIDGCLHYLVGSAPGHEFHRFWTELGALQGQHIVNMDQLYRFETADGRVFNMYCDIDRLEAEMLRVSPGDAKHIRSLCTGLRGFTKFNLVREKPPQVSSILDNAKMMARMTPSLPAVVKWSRLTLGEVSAGFENPLLRHAWSYWHDEMSAMAFMTNLAWFNNKTAGYLEGGSMSLARAIESRLLGLGGKVRYRSRVSRVIVEGNRAVGVQLESGEEHRADYVVSAADGRSTIFGLLGGEYADDKIKERFDTGVKFPPILCIGLGVKRTFDDFPQMIEGLALLLEKPIDLGGKQVGHFTTHAYNFDPTMAPSGKTTLVLTVDSDYEFWNSLRSDMGRYREEKARVADALVGILNERFQGLSGQVEMTDVATPITFERYTGNWRGHYQAWMPTPKTLTANAQMTLPGLEGFYMIGQWTSYGGLPTAASTARNAVQVICRRDGKRFQTYSTQ